MQWLLLVVTMIAMGILQRLARAAPLEARATLALGFLLIAAFVAGTIAQRVRLPRVTGALLAGLVVGPTWLGLVRPDELVALSIIVTGSLVLIAFAAGIELRVATLGDRQQRVAIARITAAAILLPFLSVTFVVLTVSPWFALTAHQPFRDALAIALALGAVASVSSPVVTWAMISDGGPSADTTLTRTLFHVTVVQDAIAVLAIGLLLALARPLGSPGAVTPGIAGIVLLRLVGSIATGILLGIIIAEYVRQLGRQTVLLLLASAFVFAQAVRLIDVEPVLMALAAGCTVSFAAAGQAEQLRATLHRSALPLYIVFFALAGCALQFDMLSEWGPWVLLLIGLRAASLWGGMRWAARHAAVPAGVTPFGWLGLVSQGGLAIALAAALRRAFPEWGITLESLLVAIVGVHLLAGPVCFQWMLGHARTGRGRPGDVSEETHVANTVDGAALVPDGGRL